MAQPYKICPQCGQVAELHAPQCLRCGHQYRTQFTPPIQQTQAVVPPPFRPRANSGVSVGNGTNPVLKGLGFCGGGCLLFFALMVLGSIAYRNQPPPGPETLALEQQMKTMEMQSADQFLTQFGYPENTTKYSLSGVDYLVWHYKRKDGSVQAWVNRPLWIVERVGSVGK